MLSLKEKENILQLSPFDKYKYFIKRVAALEVLWTLVDDEGDLAISVAGDYTLVHFWSAVEYIEDKFVEMWDKARVLEVNIDQLGELLEIIENHGHLIDVFPAGGKSGFVVNVEEFIRDLNDELDQYE